MPTMAAELTRRGTVVVVLLVAAGIAVALGVLGRAYGGTAAPLPRFGFSDPVHFKTWLATAVAVLAAGQLGTALWLFGRLPGGQPAPRWVAALHRGTGYTAFGLSLPVAFYCLYGFGFAPAPTSPRTLAHSLAGCAFYGAFAAKVLVVRTRRLPGWALPVAGAVVLTLVVVLWLSSALWLFQQSGVHL